MLDLVENLIFRYANLVRDTRTFYTTTTITTGQPMPALRGRAGLGIKTLIFFGPLKLLDKTYGINNNAKSTYSFK